MADENSIGAWAAGKRGCPRLCSPAAAPQVCLVRVQPGRCSWSPRPPFLGFPGYPGSYPSLRWSKLIFSNDSLNYIINSKKLRGFCYPCCLLRQERCRPHSALLWQNRVCKCTCCYLLIQEGKSKTHHLHLLELKLGMVRSFGGCVPQGLAEQLFLLTFFPPANGPLFPGSSAAQEFHLLAIR